MAYQDPTVWKQVGDEVLTNFGMELADDVPELLGDPPTPNVTYHRHRNCNSRIWCKNNKTVRILREVDGVVDKTNPLAVVTTKCGLTQRQPIYVRVRMEKPQAKAPTDPSLAPSPVGIGEIG